MVGRQNRAGWCWTVGSRRNDAMSATYCLPFPAQHHFHKTDCTLISVYLPFFISSSLPSCKVISCICQSCCVDFQSYNMNVSQLLHGFEKLLHGFFKVVYFALCQTKPSSFLSENSKNLDYALLSYEENIL